MTRASLSLPEAYPTTTRPEYQSGRGWLQSLVDLVYPRNCQICTAALAELDRGVVCGECLATVRWIEPPFCERCGLPFDGQVTGEFVCGHCHGLRFRFDRAICACRAEGVVRECVHRFKYQKQLYFGPHLAAWLARAAQRWLQASEIDLIVPVPLHPRRKREREFNQAELLADALGQTLKIEVCHGRLRRVQDTPTQTRLDARARAANLRQAFAVRRAEVFAERRIGLVDDVFTTGATMDSCAKVLRGAGAQRVVALAVARGI